MRKSRCAVVLLLTLLASASGITLAQSTPSAPKERKLRVEIIAHRGASHDAPENTLAAVKLGWQQKADAVEVDVYLTKDGKIAVIHDGDTKRIAGVDKRVADQTLAELQALDAGRWKGTSWAGERIPALADVLATIPDKKRMLVEIKCGPQILPELQRVVAASKKTPEQVTFISFSLEVCAAVKKAMPKHHVYYLSGFSRDEKTKAWSPTPEELISAARGAKIDGLDLAGNGPIDAELIRKVKRAGLKIFVWTIDDPEMAKTFAKMGIDGITTNRPMFLREQLSAR